MTSLKETLLQPGKRPDVLKDAEQVLNEEVSSKGGLTGMAVKAAFAIVKAIKPGIIHESIDVLLDEFVGKLEPFYEAHEQNKSAALPDYFVLRSSEIADALLSITDARAAKSKNGTMRKAYEKLRPQGKKHVQDAMPRVGRLVEKHAP